MSKKTYLLHVDRDNGNVRGGLSRKPVVWVESSRDDLRKFNPKVRGVFGHAIDLAQQGKKYRDTKPMKGGFRDINEIRVHDVSGAFRVMYTTQLAGVVYVLQAF